MHLRRAPQRVGVLDPVAVRPAVRGDHAGVGEEGHQVGGRVGLAGVRAQCLELGREHPVGAELALDRHGGSDVGGAQQPAQVGDRQHQHAEHSVGAVDERQALLLGQLHRSQAGSGQRVGGRDQVAVAVADVALPHQRERTVRERRQVTGAPERPVLVDHRRDAVGQQAGEQLGGLAAYAGLARRQRRQPQQHQPPDHLALDLRSRPGRVRPDQRALELRAQLRGDVPGRERTEPGRDAVRRRRRRRQLLDDGSRAVDRRQCLCLQPDGGALTGDRDHIGERDRSDADVDVRVLHAPIQRPSASVHQQVGPTVVSDTRQRACCLDRMR